MKAVLVVTALALLAWLGWLVARPGSGPPPPVPAPPKARPADPPGTVIRDQAEVFRKAFWKHPTAADRILHAERREWSDGGQVEKWQWFLVLEPSPALVKHLRVDNAFSLSAASSPAGISNPPAWFSFSPAAVEVLQSADGSMQLVFERESERLYATGSGRGFAKAAGQ